MITSRVLIDTGPLVALLSERDQYRDVCRNQAEWIRPPAYTCWPALAEAAHLLGASNERVRFLLSKCNGSRFAILPLDATDLPGINAILTKYHDQGFDLADACLMYLADREGIDHVFTLDHRHFSVFRTTSGQSLSLLPSL